MAKKPIPPKAASKKSAASSKKPAPAAKSKPVAAKPAVKTAAKPAPAKAPSKPGAKTVTQTAPKALPKPAPKIPASSIPKPEAPDTHVPAQEMPSESVISSPSPPPPSTLPKTVPLTVNVQTSQGQAANGNTHPANLLVLVTCAGWPVTELDKNHFTLMEHFEVPGQIAPFSNSITTFRNAGTGAYLLQTKPINGAPWRTGHHLGQLLVSSPEDQQGQAAFKIIIR